MTAVEPELTDPAEIAAARQAFLNEPPVVLEPEPPAAPVVDDAALEAEALAEQLGENKPPAGQEGEASPAAPAPAPAPTGTPDPFAAYGGEEAVRLAHQVQEAMRSEQGVRALVANGLAALGYDVEQIRTALDAAEAPAETTEEDPLAGLGDDDVLTAKDARALFQQVAERAANAAAQAQQQQLQPVQAAIEAQQATAVRSNTDAAVIAVLGPVPTDEAAKAAFEANVDNVIQRSQAYYDPNQWANPQHFRDVVQRASAELNAESEGRYQAYLASKRAARDAQPVNTGGGAAGETPRAEPRNLAEARQMAKDDGFFS